MKQLKKETKMPNVITGRTSPSSLDKWLKSEDLTKKLAELSLSFYSLIEYVHRFSLTDLKGFLEDLQKNEIAKYCLRGRLFWDSGQIQWRRVSDNEVALLIITDDTKWQHLPDDFKDLKDTLDEEITKHEDRNIILWGTFNKEENAYLERRVSGSSLIAYPDEVVKIGKKYPVLLIRQYINSSGKVALWRFRGITSKNTEELRFKGDWLNG